MVFNNYKAIKGSSVKKANIKMSYYLFQSLKSKVALYYFCWKGFEPYEFENKAWNKMKSVKYPDASLKKFFSLNPAVLFSLFQPAIWWAFYILLPFIALKKAPKIRNSSKFTKVQVWYFVTKIVLTYCEKKLF